MKKVMLVFGTRPEAIKMCPLVNTLKERKYVRIVKSLVANQNSNAQVTSVLHVLNDCDAVGDMHFIEDRDYFMKIVKRMEQELEV